MLNGCFQNCPRTVVTDRKKDIFILPTFPFTSVGYTRQDPRISHPRTPCVLCSCSGRSTDCYPENGTCYNCRTGSEGTHCERCQRGVLNSSDCTRCIPGFFGLTPLSGGCEGNEILGSFSRVVSKALWIYHVDWMIMASAEHNFFQRGVIHVIWNSCQTVHLGTLSLSIRERNFSKGVKCYMHVCF